jgi:brefeldin A-resistance guanine nucleotide exchange factor 1
MVFFSGDSTRMFASEDAVMLLSYSILMLNTDLHNPNVAKKMTLPQYINQSRGMNEGQNFDVNMLTEVYSSVKEDPIKVHYSYTTIVFSCHPFFFFSLYSFPVIY